MSTGELSTKQKLLEVAEELFATKGIEATLVGDIVSGAGQRNPSALRYHFGSREGILQAIREKYLVQLESRRTVMLANWQGDVTPRACVELIVAPLGEMLTSEAGRRYLRILGQTIYQLEPEQIDQVPPKYPSLVRSIELLRESIGHLPGPLVDERVRGAILLATAMLAVRARDLTGRRRLPLSAADFQVNVIDMTTAALTANS
ncbi:MULTISPECIES: TetR/AcrR family transcriptional regulator [Rhodococcus]|uniref:TetR family transcriptional regulator n=1 Tax=Rhodococcus globerulus TaxID=33008 RepID=A0ABU4BQL7_RHOGO|nr:MULTISPECIES: TetR family transcriptional regulator [Rhodococcus]MDV6266490.1 TetR family transcriptional regulator [Rhodococcus globerulus]ROZ49659.1 TetR/AcrR family transcriptional regulator [Rhodococcus sp. WS3]